MVKDKFMCAFNKLRCYRLDFSDKRQGFCLVLLGIFVALVLSLLANNYQWAISWLWWVLALGAVVGLLNLFHEESIIFLVTTFALTFMFKLLSELSILPVSAMNLFYAEMYLLAPAVVLVSLKVFYALAMKK